MNKEYQKLFHDNINYLEDKELNNILNAKFSKIIADPGKLGELKYVLLELSKELYSQSNKDKSSIYYQKAIEIQRFLKQHHRTTSKATLEEKIAMVVDSFKDVSINSYNNLPATSEQEEYAQ